MSDAGQRGRTKPGRRRATALRGAAAALASAVVLVAGGSEPHPRSGPRQSTKKHGQDELVRDAVVAYFAALADGDLGTLRALTCPGYHDDFFRTVDPEQYKTVHQNETATGDVFELDSVDSVTLAPPTARAQVTARSKAAPSPRRLVFALRQSDGGWQVCEPEGSGPPASPR